MSLHRHQKRRKTAPTYRRQEMNTDRHWVNWEFLAAFGVDERGYTYLAAVKQHCCLADEPDEWLDNVVRRARKACEKVGSVRVGNRAAWRILRWAGLVVLHDLMKDLRRPGRVGPHAAFFEPGTSQVWVVGRNWKRVAMPRDAAVPG